MYIVKMNPADLKPFKNKKFAIIDYFGKKVLVKLVKSDEVKPRYCEVDQAIRNALGFPGRECYGSLVSIQEVKRSLEWNSFIQRLFPSRSLVLPLYRGSWLDSEKNICIMHPKLISLLGLEEGEYVNIYAVCSRNDCRRDLHKLVRRVYSGVPDSIPRDGKKIKYPQPTEFYLDLDGRIALHLEAEQQGYPIIVRPSVVRIIRKRAIFYGLTLLLGIDAINSLLAPFFLPSALIRFLMTIFLATLIMLIVTYYDVRDKISL